MASILVSYTDGVLNIDRADAGRKGEKDREGEREREREAERHYFLFPLGSTWLLSGIQFCWVGTSVKRQQLHDGRDSESYMHSCAKQLMQVQWELFHLFKGVYTHIRQTMWDL